MGWRKSKELEGKGRWATDGVGKMIEWRGRNTWREEKGMVRILVRILLGPSPGNPSSAWWTDASPPQPAPIMVVLLLLLPVVVIGRAPGQLLAATAGWRGGPFPVFVCLSILWHFCLFFFFFFLFSWRQRYNQLQALPMHYRTNTLLLFFHQLDFCFLHLLSILQDRVFLCWWKRLCRMLEAKWGLSLSLSLCLSPGETLVEVYNKYKW